MRTISRCGALAFVATLLAATSLSATQTPQDSDWRAWYGCWRAEDAPASEYLCIAPAGANAVRMMTVVGGDVVAESRVITDGKAREVKQEGCTGSEVAYWSADGQRVFLKSDLTCEQGIKRSASGMFAFTSSIEWLSAQAVTVVDQTATRTVRYVAVEPNSLPPVVASALRASGARGYRREAVLARVDENDINEAANNIDPVAVQEWIDALGLPYEVAERATSVQANSISALDQVSRVSTGDYYNTREVVHVVERPTYVHTTTYVNNVVRSCWDPFYSGFVLGFGHGVRFGVYGYSGCGRHYYTRYSPWGYDLHGWHWRRGPLVVVRNGPTIIRNYPDRDRYPGRDRYDDDDFDRRSRGGIATRDGYRAPPGSREPDRTRSTTTTTRTNDYDDSQSTRSTTRTAQPSSRSRGGTSSNGVVRSTTSSGGVATRDGYSSRGPAISRSSSGSYSSGGTITRSNGSSVTRSSGNVSRSSGNVTRSSGGTVTRSSDTRSSGGSRASSSSQSSGSRSSGGSTRTAKPRGG
jgi:hypothetical protein